MSSIFQHQPAEPRPLVSDYGRMARTAIAAAGTFFFLLTHSLILAIVGGAGAGILTWYFPDLRLRRRVIAILCHVSSSRAHDRFVQLAIQILGSPAHVRRYRHLLWHIARRRKHPCSHTLEILEKILTQKPTADTIEPARKVAMYLDDQKTTIRQNATTHLIRYLSEKVTDQTIIVLYGYSTVICTALATVRPFPGRVILVKDQENIPHSHQEHEAVTKRLKSMGRQPIPIPLRDAPEKALARKLELTDRDGSSVKRHDAPTIVLLGCETYATDGTVFLPPRMEDSGVLSFLRAVEDAIPKRKQKLELLIVGDILRMRPQLTPAEHQEVTPPLIYSFKTVPKFILYILTGKERFLPSTQVSLRRVDPKHITAVVDDSGIHPPTAVEEFKSALHAWMQKLWRVQGPADPGFINSCDAYILDMRGVLSNDELDHHHAFDSLVRDFKCTLPKHIYEEHCLGRGDHEAVDNLIAVGLITGDRQELVQKKRKHFRTSTRGQAKPYHHAVELVKLLAARDKRLFLVTSSPAEDVKRFIDGAGLGFAFNGQNTYTDLTPETREDTYKKIIRASGFPPQNIAVIDDSPANLKLARSLRLRTIGVLTTHTDLYSADDVVHSVDDLYTKIEPPPMY